MQASLVELTSKLISYQSVSSDKSTCKQLLEYVSSLFDKTAFLVRWYESQGVHSIVVSRQAIFEFDLVFLGHVDVVPGPSEIFTPRIEGGKLYGRGSADMKGSVAAMISLFLEHENTNLLDDCALVLTSDEEVGGRHGAGYLIEELGLQANVAFVPDGGAALTACIFEKGIQHAKISTRGVSAHGSRPWLGASAVDALLDDLQSLRAVFQRASVDNQWDLSLNIGKIEGGKAGNLVADSASALLDFRFSDQYTVGKVQEMITMALRHSDIEFVGHGEAVRVNEECSIYKLFAESLARYGGSATGIPEHGTSDARWFMKQGTTLLITMPLCSPFHIVDEWVSVDGLAKFYEAIREFCCLHLSETNESLCTAAA